MWDRIIRKPQRGIKPSRILSLNDSVVKLSIYVVRTLAYLEIGKKTVLQKCADYGRVRLSPQGRLGLAWKKLNIPRCKQSNLCYF
jgi:hypothetical protein